jgi:hypothetical protein
MPGMVFKRGRVWVTKWGGREYKHASKRLAEAQLNLLRAKEHGWRPGRFRRG